MIITLLNTFTQVNIFGTVIGVTLQWTMAKSMYDLYSSYQGKI